MQKKFNDIKKHRFSMVSVLVAAVIGAFCGLLMAYENSYRLTKPNFEQIIPLELTGINLRSPEDFIYSFHDFLQKQENLVDVYHSIPKDDLPIFVKAAPQVFNNFENFAKSTFRPAVGLIECVHGTQYGQLNLAIRLGSQSVELSMKIASIFMERFLVEQQKKATSLNIQGGNPKDTNMFFKSYFEYLKQYQLQKIEISQKIARLTIETRLLLAKNSITPDPSGDLVKYLVQLENTALAGTRMNLIKEQLAEYNGQLELIDFSNQSRMQDKEAVLRRMVLDPSHTFITGYKLAPTSGIPEALKMPGYLNALHFATGIISGALLGIALFAAYELLRIRKS